MANPRRARRAYGARKGSKRERSSQHAASPAGMRLHLVVGVPIVVFAIVVATLLLLTQLWATNPPAAGAYAPEFRLEGTDDEAHLLSDFRGIPTVVYFMTLDCAPCAGPQLAALKDLNVDFSGRFTLLTVNLGVNNSIESLRAFQQEYIANWLHLVGTDSVEDSYLIETVPTTIIIDPGGFIVNRHDGVASYDALSADLREALQK